MYVCVSVYVCVRLCEGVKWWLLMLSALNTCLARAHSNVWQPLDNFLSIFRSLLSMDLCVCLSVCACVFVHLQVWTQAGMCAKQIFKEEFFKCIDAKHFLYGLQHLPYMHAYTHINTRTKTYEAQSRHLSQSFVLPKDQHNCELYMQLWPQSCSHSPKTETHTDRHTHIFMHRHLRALVGHQEMKGSFSLEGDERIEEEKRWRKRRRVCSLI